MSEPTKEQPQVSPGVTTAPAGSGWSRIPDHLGRARTSTVVLAVLFVAIFALYLNIRPDPAVPATGSTTQNGTTTQPSEAPATTTTAPDTTQDQPTTTETPTTSDSTGLPTPTATPSGTDSTSAVPGPLPTPSATATSPAG